MLLDRFLEGAFDLHCHVYPEMTLEHEARQDDVSLLAGMQAAGMGGVVLKSHFWPTVDRCYYLGRQFPDLRVFPSITLNRVAGGLDPLVVDAAGRQGAKVVFFPTWDSANDRRRGGFCGAVRQRLPAYFDDDGTGLEVLEDGKLSGRVQEVLDAAQQFGMLVCTGHLAPAESMQIIEAARQRGLPALFSHPMSGSIGASLEDMREAARRGAVIELCVLHTLSLGHYIPPSSIADTIRALGAEHCVLSTDAFNSWVPPAHELLRLGIGQLLECGLGEEEIRVLTVTNPRRLLGLDARNDPAS
jgi:hypothetical protein